MSHPKITKEMKAMAIAILQDEFEAAVALRDAIEECKQGIPIPPIKRIINSGNLRVVVYVKSDPMATEEELRMLERDVQSWIKNGGSSPLIVTGLDKIELYEIEVPKEETPIGRRIDVHPNMSEEELTPEEKEEIDLGKIIDTRDRFDRGGGYACYRG